MNKAALAVCATLALALVAATAVTAEEGIPVRDCGTRGDPSSGTPMFFVRSGDVVAGPISFSSLKHAATRSSLGTRRPDGTGFRKSAAKVLWGRPATLGVPAEHRSFLSLGFAQTGRPSDAVRFDPCPPGTKMWGPGDRRLRRVTGFPGGFVIRKPGCYAVEVHVDGGRTHRVRIAFGYPCR